MQLTWEQWKAMKKLLRRKLGMPGWTLLVYYLIMNAAVFLWVLVQTLTESVSYILRGDFAAVEQAALRASESGWGYFLAAGVGFLVLLLWKKPRFLKEEVFARGNPMTAKAFFGILCIFLGCQFLSQLMLTVFELGLNQFGLSILEGAAALSVDPDNFSMFLYASLLAPVSEEILFRGLIQRSLMPYGKRFAVLCSAFTFGLFHGNLIQTPFAFLVGLVLGYVASEYSVLWAMLLHMINNLLLADSLNRLLSFLPDEESGIVIWSILLLFALAGLLFLSKNREGIQVWKSQEAINKTCLRCFFSSFGTILFMVLMGIMMAVSLFLMIAPL